MSRGKSEAPVAIFCWCGGRVAWEAGRYGRHGYWCQFGHPQPDDKLPPWARKKR